MLAKWFFGWGQAKAASCTCLENRRNPHGYKNGWRMMRLSYYMPALAPTVRSGDNATEQSCHARGPYLGGLLREGGKVPGLLARPFPLPVTWRILVK